MGNSRVRRGFVVILCHTIERGVLNGHKILQHNTPHCLICIFFSSWAENSLQVAGEDFTSRTLSLMVPSPSWSKAWKAPGEQNDVNHIEHKRTI